VKDPSYWLELIYRKLFGSDITAVVARSERTNNASVPAIQTDSEALAANANRIAWSIQNLGTNPLYLRFGSGASTTEFHRLLVGGAVQDDGQGGILEDEIYTGVVTVAGTSPRYVVAEMWT